MKNPVLPAARSSFLLLELQTENLRNEGVCENQNDCDSNSHISCTKVDGDKVCYNQLENRHPYVFSHPDSHTNKELVPNLMIHDHKNRLLCGQDCPKDFF